MLAFVSFVFHKYDFALEDVSITESPVHMVVERLAVITGVGNVLTFTLMVSDGNSQPLLSFTLTT